MLTASPRVAARRIQRQSGIIPSSAAAVVGTSSTYCPRTMLKRCRLSCQGIVEMINRNTLRWSWACLLGLTLVHLAPAEGEVASQAALGSAHTVLDTWLSGLNSLRAKFTQTTTDGQGHQVDQASGELLLLRPGRFRWESHADAPAKVGTSSPLPTSATETMPPRY